MEHTDHMDLYYNLDVTGKTLGSTFKIYFGWLLLSGAGCSTFPNAQNDLLSNTHNNQFNDVITEKNYYNKNEQNYSGAPHSDVNLFRINRRYVETSLNGMENPIGTH